MATLQDLDPTTMIISIISSWLVVRISDQFLGLHDLGVQFILFIVLAATIVITYQTIAHHGSPSMRIKHKILREITDEEEFDKGGTILLSHVKSGLL